MATVVTASSLALASQQMSIYIGFFLFIAGMIGGFLVLIVFLSLQTFRQSSCAFYLTIKSTVNIFYLLIGLLPFIMSNGFGTNWSNVSLFYCKFRIFYVQLGSLISVTCTCLAAIDQFLATCSNPRWHQWNNIIVARNMMIGTVIIWTLYTIPFPIYYNHFQSPLTGRISCTVTNAIFIRFQLVVHVPFFLSSLPVIIMTLFGILAYRNVKQIAHRTVPFVRRELDKQLTCMVLVQVFYDVFFVLPIIIQTVYNAIIATPNDLDTLTLINFVRNLTTLLYYTDFVGSFYIYVCVSKRFRQQLIYVLLTVHLNRWFHPKLNTNQVEPQV